MEIIKRKEIIKEENFWSNGQYSSKIKINQKQSLLKNSTL